MAGDSNHFVLEGTIIGDAVHYETSSNFVLESIRAWRPQGERAFTKEVFRVHVMSGGARNNDVRKYLTNGRRVSVSGFLAPTGECEPMAGQPLQLKTWGEVTLIAPKQKREVEEEA